MRLAFSDEVCKLTVFDDGAEGLWTGDVSFLKRRAFRKWILKDLHKRICSGGLVSQPPASSTHAEELNVSTYFPRCISGWNRLSHVRFGNEESRGAS